MIYSRCLATSDRVSWLIDDVIQGRELDFTKRFMPGLSIKTGQVAARTYLNLFILGERFIETVMSEVASERHGVAKAALDRFCEEEGKHQRLFSLVDAQLAPQVPGYRFIIDTERVTQAVRRVPRWAALALILHVELITQRHYVDSLRDADLCPLWKDLFRYHWIEECQHVKLDAAELQRTNPRAPEVLDMLFSAMERLLIAQARVDSELAHEDLTSVYMDLFMVRHPRFTQLLTGSSRERIRPAAIESQVSIQ